MGRLRRQGLVEPIIERVRAGTWFVGVCLGMQLLFETSREDGARMLGLLEGDVEVIPDAPSLPHIGWNQIESRHPVFEDGEWYYFVHSYYVDPAESGLTAATTDFGVSFASAVADQNLFAVQFHPEKSQTAGFALLRARTARFINDPADWEPLPVTFPRMFVGDAVRVGLLFGSLQREDVDAPPDGRDAADLHQRVHHCHAAGR